MKKNRLFITGMSGTAGRALARVSISRNYQVGGIVHQHIPSELKTLINQNLLQIYHIDLKDKKAINKTIQNFQPNIVIHLAGKVLGGTDKKVLDSSIYEENLLIFNNTLNAIKTLKKLPRFILSSGCLVYNKQTSVEFVTEIPIWDLPEIDSKKQPYRASKADMEKILSKEKNLDYIVARPTQFTGPGKIPGVIEWYIATEILKIKKGEAKSICVRNKLGEVDILDARDIAKAFLTLAKKGITRETYHISSGSPVTVATIGKILLDISGLDPSSYPVMSTDKENISYFRFSPHRLNKLGWKPQFNLKSTLTSYWEYFKNKKAK